LKPAGGFRVVDLPLPKIFVRFFLHIKQQWHAERGPGLLGVVGIIAVNARLFLPGDRTPHAAVAFGHPDFGDPVGNQPIPSGITRDSGP
jgi:hypothetical protein